MFIICMNFVATVHISIIMISIVHVPILMMANMIISVGSIPLTLFLAIDYMFVIVVVMHELTIATTIQ